jgi:hypothetical protein
MKAAKELDVCMRNHFRLDAEALGAWAIARHLEQAPRRQEETATPPPPPGDGGSGSNANTASNG